MILKDAENCYYDGKQLKKIYLGKILVYSLVTPPSPPVSESDMVGSSTADSYESGSTTWGDLNLSTGCEISKDGIEIQNDETYISTQLSGLSYPVSFEWKGRIDSSCYKAQANNPGMIFGFGPTQNGWGDGVTCYSTTDYGIIIDTVGAMSITTYKMPAYAHIVITINSSGVLTMYLNGINNTWSCGSNDAITSNKNYVFNGQGVGRFIGAINTIRWWDVSLSIDDITELFSSDSDDYDL